MDNTPVIRESQASPGFLQTFQAARQHAEETTWQKLGTVTVEQALQAWGNTLKPLTAKNYMAGFRKLMDYGLVDGSLTLQQFCLINHEAVIDDIKMIPDWSEATRQARAAAYITFTGFLQRRTRGLVNKAVASKDGNSKTFFKVREKVKTEALTQRQTLLFLQALESINPRDALIAKILLQGGKRKSEVLGLRVDQIDFSRHTITFRQTKTRGTVKETVINYPEHVMTELKSYIGHRTGLVFITRHQRQIAPFQIDRTFRRAGEKAGIPFRVTPHVMRVTLVTRLKELKIQDTDIMKITGHANPAQLNSYDKTDRADNATLYHHFV